MYMRDIKMKETKCNDRLDGNTKGMGGIVKKVKFLALTTMWILVLFTQIVNTGRQTKTFGGGVGRNNEKNCI